MELCNREQVSTFFNNAWLSRGGGLDSVRTKSLAPITSSNENAICSTISARLSRGWKRRPGALAPCCRLLD